MIETNAALTEIWQRIRALSDELKNCNDPSQRMKILDELAATAERLNGLENR
jgi:hypothetical protein